MENLKYKMTDETVRAAGGVLLHRIQALRDFGSVKCGDYGGYIESEENLSQNGSCWIYDSARVSGSAHVSDDAKIRGKASVSGNALVAGSASISDGSVVAGHASILGCSVICGSSYVSEDSVISGNSLINSSSVSGHAKIFGDAIIAGSLVCGNAMAGQRAHTEISVLSGNAVLTGHCIIRMADISGSVFVTSNEAAGELAVITGRNVRKLSDITLLVEGDTEISGNIAIDTSVKDATLHSQEEYESYRRERQILDRKHAAETQAPEEEGGHEI